MSSMLYFKEGDKIAESGNVRVYSFNNDLFLEIGEGHTLWALESELSDYIEQLGGRPKGNVLEIGLGLGVASRYILSLPNVRALTTVEANSDVVNVYNTVMERDRVFMENFSHKKHLVLNTDGLSYIYNTKRKFDFIFMDFYDRIDEDTLPEIKDMVDGCKRSGILADGGEIMGWFDPYTPDEFVKEFNDIFSGKKEEYLYE